MGELPCSVSLNACCARHWGLRDQETRGEQCLPRALCPCHPTFSLDFIQEWVWKQPLVYSGIRQGLSKYLARRLSDLPKVTQL